MVLMEGSEDIMFVYNEAAVVVRIDGKKYLVIGDLHLGVERKLLKKGVRIYSVVENTINRVRRLCAEFAVAGIIILGDVKDTILYPERWEQEMIRKFFDDLKGYDITITLGNHDGHLNEIIDCKMVDELVLGEFAFMHGHKWPSERAMLSKFIFVGHNHAAVSMKDKNGATYTQKAWLVAKINKKNAAKQYKRFNEEVQLVVLPAFNDLITGMPVNEAVDENLSPLFRNGVFDYKKARVYSIRGELVGTPSSLKTKTQKSR